MSYPLTIVIPGEPVTQGNMKAYLIGGKARLVHKNSAAIKAYRAAAARSAEQASAPLIDDGAVQLSVTFILKRPKTHFGTGRNAEQLKAWAPSWHTGQRPDWDKLGRALSDALTGVCWRDDGQLAQVLVTKRYAAAGEASRTVVTYKPLAEEREERDADDSV